MIGLDTNVLVRLLTADDPDQAVKAEEFTRRHCTPASPGFINCVVVAELVWVLANPYQYARDDIVAALEMLLAGNDRVFEHDEEVRTALDDYRAGRLDFTDALILRINRAHGCEATATFDRKAAKLDGFVRVG